MNQVTAIAHRRPDGIWTLKLECPYCGRVHVHGGGDGETPSGGWRASHCLTRMFEQ